MGKNDNNLGRAMIKSRMLRKSGGKSSWIHTSDLNDGSDWNRINFQSVTEQNSLDEFLTTAELAGSEFEAERLNIKFVSKPKVGILSKEEREKIQNAQDKHRSYLRIPRRPLWKENTDLTSEEYKLKERDAFLDWRKNLAQLQDVEGISLTPFEKNLEFWKQLWRVIERSDVIVQIVDARNPLLFRCEDLESYVKEVDKNKINLILINKSDLLTPKQRLEWKKYFDSKNCQVVFWSAHDANEANQAESKLSNEEHDVRKTKTDLHKDHDEDLIEEDEEEDEGEGEDSHDHKEHEDEEGDEQVEEENEDEEEEGEDDNDDDYEEEEDDDEEEEAEDEDDKDVKELVEKVDKLNTSSIKDNEKTENQTNENSKIQNSEQNESASNIDPELEKCKILTRDELIHLFKTIHKDLEKIKPGSTTIGMVGYPNVGKSSTINALLKAKKVAVSETPGKTKHYQTLFIDDELLLCDCPGLVFPSFVATKGELILNGILPVDQMRDYVEPINILCSHIPGYILEITYGIMLPKPREGEDPDRAATAEELCSVYSYAHGYMNHRGLPDVQRGARYIIKDYINGKIVYAYPPPSVDDKSFQDFKIDPLKRAKYLEKCKKLDLKKEDKSKLSEFDAEFFRKLEPRAVVKSGVAGYSRINKEGVSAGASVDTLNAKPWKKHFNSKKREKLRKKTSYLDN